MITGLLQQKREKKYIYVTPKEYNFIKKRKVILIYKNDKYKKYKKKKFLAKKTGQTINIF